MQRPYTVGLGFVLLTAAASRLVGGGEPMLLPADSGVGSATVAVEKRSSTPAAYLKNATVKDRIAADAGAAGVGMAEGEALGAICAYVGGNAHRNLAGRKGSSASGKGFAGAGLCTESKSQVLYAKATPRVLIAILPDPIHTHLSLRFDRSIDALEDAAQRNGWMFEQKWLPWDHKDRADPSDFADREQERRFEEGREQVPGVMLFRPRAEDGKALIVLMVGDSPTGGVAKEQFRRALRWWKAIDESATGPELGRLQVLGPSFSGSLPSLQALIEQEGVSDRMRIETASIASGSVSTDVTTYPIRLGGEGRPEKLAEFVSFATVLANENEAALEYLVGHRIEPEQIAILSEQESAYGALALEPAGENAPGPAAAKADGSQRKAKPAAASNLVDRVFHISFPREISQLRNAYQKNSIWGFGGTSGGSAHVSLQLNLEDKHHGQDTVPVFSEQQTPLSQEAIMGQIANVLEQRHTRVALLSATDVLDELFVSQMLAHEAPNVTVIVEDADDLFLRSGDLATNRNMFAVSPWPLIVENEGWSMPKDADAPFRTYPSRDTQGYYTAARYLLDGDGETTRVREYRSPLDQREVARTQPPLWLSAIGRGGYWPVALLSEVEVEGRGQDAAEPASNAGGTQERARNLPMLETRKAAGLVSSFTPLSLRLFGLSGLVLIVFHGATCIFARVDREFGWRSALSDTETRDRRIWLLLSTTLLAIPMLELLVPPQSEAVRGYTLVFALAVLGMQMISVGIAAILLQRLARGGPGEAHGKDQRRSRRLQAMVGVLLTAGILAFCRFSMWDAISPSWANGEMQFFHYRAMHPFSGSSPILPLLILLSGIGYCTRNWVGRLAFCGPWRPRIPADMEARLNCPSEATMRPLNRLLGAISLDGDGPGPTPRRWIRSAGRYLAERREVVLVLLLTAAAMAIAIITDSDLIVRTMDGGKFDRCLHTLVIAVLLLQFFDLFMAFAVWRRLKEDCLQRLERSALRHGFDYVEGFSWKSLWTDRCAVPTAAYKALIRAIEQWKRGEFRKGLTNVPASVEKSIDSIREMTVETPAAERAARFGDLQEQIAIAVKSVIEQDLAKVWAADKELVTRYDAMCTVEELKDRIKSEPTRAAQEEFVALVYINYIRMVLLQIRTRIVTAGLLYLLLVWSLTSYPIIERHHIVVALSVLLAIYAAVILMIYSQMHRDDILSRTTETKPGELDAAFYTRILSVLGIPLLGLLASQFPEISNFLFSWLEPGLASFK